MRLDGYQKYSARKAEVDGHVFDSRAEGRRYQELRILEAAGEISDLTLQPEFVLQEAFLYRGQRERAIKYRGDFQYLENGQVVVEDVKGYAPEVFKLKAKLFRARYPHIELRIVKS